MILGVFLGTLFFGLALGVPVAFALMFCGVVMMWWMGIFNPQIISQQMVTGANTFTLLAIPFFTFMGIILERSGMAEDLLDTIGQLFGPIRGGLAFWRCASTAGVAATTGVVMTKSCRASSASTTARTIVAGVRRASPWRLTTMSGWAERPESAAAHRSVPLRQASGVITTAMPKASQASAIPRSSVATTTSTSPDRRSAAARAASQV